MKKVSFFARFRAAQSLAYDLDRNVKLKQKDLDVLGLDESLFKRMQK